MPGFVWRYTDDSGSAVNTRPFADPRMAINLSVWENVAALEQFVYQTIHKRFYGRRAEWFEHLDDAYFVDVVGARRSPAERARGDRAARTSQAARA